MTNEILFFAVLLCGLISLPLAAARGAVWLQGLIVMMALLLGITDGKVIDVFGLPTTLGTALYVTIFLASDVLTENYGRKIAYDTARMSVFVMILFQIYLQAIRIADPAADVQSLSDAMDIVFTTSLRLVAAGMFVYALAQHLDIFLYDKLRALTHGRHLWLRNNASTLVSQLFDTFAFAFLAFYGVFDGWLQLAAVAYAVKVFVIILDTPFAYLSRAVAKNTGNPV